MTTLEFIEAAMEGGWEVLSDTADKYIARTMPIEKVVLNPKAWEAVGRTKKWTQLQIPLHVPAEYHIDHEWKFHMHMMIIFLIKGRTVEEYIESL